MGTLWEIMGKWWFNSDFTKCIQKLLGILKKRQPSIHFLPPSLSSIRRSHPPAFWTTAQATRNRLSVRSRASPRHGGRRGKDQNLWRSQRACHILGYPYDNLSWPWKFPTHLYAPMAAKSDSVRSLSGKNRPFNSGETKQTGQGTHLGPTEQRSNPRAVCPYWPIDKDSPTGFGYSRLYVPHVHTYKYIYCT